ncbi:hypothetical protein SKTS_04410 [Sulfurimicrobium lacus]|uniref:Uncharacterized protein n=1 Tax=Sulfurimicrobium lacus TaxID=2715678 RepID=A0A6F8V9W4_9PROT|nr:hypothetical protein [Sulfurimicrobium lacus]BCB25555.1 hypothetical protein SKTS_04410 [Sulfurimicrobium lacus]
MKLAGADWQALRYPLLVLAAALLVSAALVFFTRQELNQEKSRYTRQEGVLREAHERLQKSGDEKDKILRYRASYLALQQQGFVGDEQRINWVDALRAASLNLKMFGVSYQIEAQQPYQSPAVTDAGQYRIHQSLMKINLGLLHEEDLMRFLNALEEQRAGIFSLRECTLQRQSAGKVENAKVQPNLQADCSLDWLSISEARGAENP